MTTVKEIIDAIYDFAPLSLQESYDNCGLQTGDPDMASTGVLLAVDMTEELLDEAIGLGLNTILTHHPLIFRGIANVTPSHPAGRIVMKAVKHDIAIISAHTNIDKAYRGVSYRMGSKLGLRDMRPLAEANDACGTGLGVIGLLPEAIATDEFLRMVKEVFGCGCLRHTAPSHEKANVVALCGGSGSSFISDAIDAGADIYISADFKYHDFFAADGKITLADAGHFETERCTIDIFYDILTKKFTNFAVRQASTYTNPVIYLH